MDHSRHFFSLFCPPRETRKCIQEKLSFFRRYKHLFLLVLPPATISTNSPPVARVTLGLALVISLCVIEILILASPFLCGHLEIPVGPPARVEYSLPLHVTPKHSRSHNCQGGERNHGVICLRAWRKEEISVTWLAEHYSFAHFHMMGAHLLGEEGRAYKKKSDGTIRGRGLNIYRCGQEHEPSVPGYRCSVPFFLRRAQKSNGNQSDIFERYEQISHSSVHS